MIRYSDSLEDEALKHKVLRIAARYGDEFRTCAFRERDDVAGDGARPGTGGGADDRSSLFKKCWREAVCDEDGLWTVTEYSAASAAFLSAEDFASEDGENAPAVAVRPEIILKGCFFDALYACAVFEQGERASDLSERTGPSSAQLGSAHYKSFAKNEGIPFDITTHLPVPAIDKIVLTDKAVLAEEALEVLKKSKGNMAKEPPRGISAADILGEKQAVAAKSRALAAVPPGANAQKNALAVAGSDLAHLSRRNKTVDGITKIYEKRHGNLELLPASIEKLDNLPDTISGIKLPSTGRMLTSTAFFAVHSGVALSIAVGGIMAGEIVTGTGLGVLGGMMSLAGVGGLPALLFSAGPGGNIDDACMMTFGIDSVQGSARMIKKAGLSLWARQTLCRHFSRTAAQERRMIARGAEAAPQKAEQLTNINMAETGFYALAARQAFNIAAENGGWLKRRQAQKALKTFWHVAQRCEVAEDDIRMIIDDIRHEPVPARQYDPFAEKMKKRLSGYIDKAHDNVCAAKNRQLAKLPPPGAGS